MADHDNQPKRAATNHRDTAPTARWEVKMTRTDWHVLALAMFIAPLTVTGVGWAVSRGNNEALIAVGVAVSALVVHLTRHRRRHHVPAARSARPDGTTLPADSDYAGPLTQPFAAGNGRRLRPHGGPPLKPSPTEGQEQ
ncbi:hypothetical protein Aau02nite_50890 [Amorphoplanes auranticolor]|uniref:Uncharacterized protein n=1 Tax=Actinoplanes auranticolor TaxID=47988 RepID=A0A919SIN9_9ACTN|nr:hypothetical protein Aau02nite_50890 [Actinoplanes auranticolor]